MNGTMNGTSPHAVAEVLVQAFRGRVDEVAYATGSAANHRAAPDGITAEMIERLHLSGRERLGFYLLDKDSRCYTTCADIDNHGGSNPQWREQVEAIYGELQRCDLDPLVERSKSGEGAHVWLLLNGPTDPWIVRQFWRRLFEKIGIPAETEVFPKQDELDEGGLGNLVWFPCSGKSAFVDPEDVAWPAVDPVQALQSTRRTSGAELREVAARAGMGELIEPSGGQSPPPRGDRPATPDDMAIARAALDKLSPARAENRDDWIAVGMSLHSVGDDLLDDWDAFSRRCPEKYQEGECQKLWGGFARDKPKSITAGSLIAWARADSGDQEFGKRVAPPAATNGASPDPAPRSTRKAARVAANRPAISAGAADLIEVRDLALDAIGRWNTPPKLFRFGGLPARIGHTDAGAPIVATVSDEGLRSVLAEAAAWYRGDGKNRHPAYPPLAIAKAIAAMPDKSFPSLQRIVATPVFASDGSLSTDTGYNPATRTFYEPSEDLEIPAIAESPTPAEVERARSLILDDLLGDFPFASDADRANCVALFLLPFVREMVADATPLHLIEKPTPGSGAGLLVDVLTIVATGRPAGVMTEGGKEDEWRKRITATLLSAPSVVLIDNLQRRLDSPSLAAAITAIEWEDRLLGSSQMVRLPVRCAWIATGNNPSVSSEIARRTVTIRIDPKADRPWLRAPSEFRHQDLRAWAHQHRGELVWAALTLTRVWIARGRPPGSQSLGNFEGWARTLGGILNAVGVPEFLANAIEFYDRADAEGEAWRELVQAWREAHGEEPVGTAELWTLIDSEGLGFDLGAGNEKSQKTRLGIALKRARDRRYGELRVEHAGTLRRAGQWRLVECEPCEPCEP